MMTEANEAHDVETRAGASAAARCPHLLFRDVLGEAALTALLDYAIAQQANFRPAIVRSRKTGEKRVDRDLRNCLSLADVGTFDRPIKGFIRSVAAPVLARQYRIEPGVEPKEFEITAFGDGGHFGNHIDTAERTRRVRILSCVYYFAATPRRFTGGELRLYGLPTLSGSKDGGRVPFVDVMPETDTLVVFPSWLRHEVLPVRVPSGAWADGRFTINCWIHRMSQPAGAAPAHPDGGSG
jgi:SM-20-related protein